MKCWRLFLELNSKGLYQRSEKEKEGRCLVFRSSTKREITAKKCTKKRDARVKLFFCQAETYCFFCRSCCRRRRRCLSSLLSYNAKISGAAAVSRVHEIIQSI